MRNVKQISYQWVAKNYANRFKVNPYMKLQEIVAAVKIDWGIDVSLYLAFKAKRAAIDLIVGEYKHQYSLLNEYAAELLRLEPRNTIILQLDGNVFQKMYFGFYALIEGFKQGCRPFISIDGCFLKGPFGGQLLVAVGRDGNNQMYPFTWAVVDKENTDSWEWFLGLLASDLGTADGAGYVIMSDQQKGLLKAVDTVFSAAEKRCCARHVYMNFKGALGGQTEYRRWFWRIAKSNTEVEFHSNMWQFSLVSEEAAADLLERNYEKWCRAFYTPMSCCDNVDNNMSEVFNAYILKSRHKPIITMLEDIREAIMERLHKKRDFVAKKNIAICPRISYQLERAKVAARGWSAYWDGKFSFGVREGTSQERYVVHLINRTCTCNSWQLNGIPCNHAVAAIWQNNEEPEIYVADYYKKWYYLKAYQLNLDNVKGASFWKATGKPPVEAPFLKKVKACRPTTKRRKSVLEDPKSTKRSRKGVHMTCWYCGGHGHNKKGCNLPTETKKLIEQEKLADERQRKHDMQEKQLQRVANKQLKEAKKQQSQMAKQAPNLNRQSPTNSLPMHERGIGNYIYPNGFSTVANMSLGQRNVAYYRDVEGIQTLRSCTTNYRGLENLSQSSSSSHLTPSFLDQTRMPCISSQTSQDLISIAQDEFRLHTN